MLDRATPGRHAVRYLLSGVVLLLAVAAFLRSTWADRAESDPTVILVSIDGFRWDFLDRAETPNLDRLTATGVRAERLVPVFPTLTFPNHYSIVTGLYPEDHGVVSNTMYDPAFDAWFRIRDRDAVSDGRWWGGEPIWVTAERQGLTAGTFFWPGSEAAVGGRRPTYWNVYDDDMPDSAKVEPVLQWLDLPPEERPSFVTLYFVDVDHTNHAHNPESDPAIAEAIRRVDRALGRLLEGLDARGLTDEVNIVVVSDHGIVARSPDRVIFLEDYIDVESANVIEWHPVATLRPEAAHLEDVYRSLAGAHPRLQVYRKNEIPERLHYRDHRRIAPIIAIADEGWSITSRAYFERNRHRFDRGTHGYDHEASSMGALFVASGPAFERGLTVAPFQNIHVYPLLCHVLGIEPAPNAGSLDSVRVMLRR